MSPRITRRVTYGRSTYPKHLTVTDVWGERWRVYERRPTPYGFAVYLGKPNNIMGEKKGGKPEVIVTPPLAANIEANLKRPYSYPLPIGDNARRRIRQHLGVDHRAWIDKRTEWWMDRLDDLSALTAREFVARHRATAWTRWGSLSQGLVCRMRILLLGHRRHPRGWWKTPEVRSLVLSSIPVPEIARRLELSPLTVYGVRDRIRKLMRSKAKSNGRPLERVYTLVPVHENGRAPAARQMAVQNRRGTASALRPSTRNGNGSSKRAQM